MRFLSGAVPGLLLLLGVGSFRADNAASAEAQPAVSLENYGLRPEDATHWELPRRLREISGLARTGDHRLLAHNDEAGIIFELDVRTGSVLKEFQLADVGDPVAEDFEGIAVADGRIYLVSSAGRLYEFPEGSDGESVLFTVYATGVGRACEVEGLAYDERPRELLLMCKDPRTADLVGQVAIYRWSVEDKRLRDGAPTTIPVRELAGRIGANRYRPSGIELHPVSGNYFVVAARQGAIAEVTPEGEVVAARRFLAGWHRQLEGITFAADGTLLVADEGGEDRAILTAYPAPSGSE